MAVVVSSHGMTLFVVGLLVLASQIHGGESGSRLACVQCSPADPRCESGSLEPTACLETDKYCAMYRVFIGSSQGIFRGCSHLWLRGCRRKVIEEHEIMICFQTCSWHGCNAGYGSKAYLL